MRSKGVKFKGVHAFIKALYGHRFQHPGGTKAKTKVNSLVFGRMFDSTVMRLVKGLKPNRQKVSNRAHRYADAVVRYLNRSGMTVVKGQQLVSDPDRFMVRTPIDLLCITGDGVLHVVELKTTQFTTESHLRNYCKASRGNAFFRHNALYNSEYVHHQMQIGLAMCIMKRVYGVKTVKGVVLMVTTDTAGSQRCHAYPHAPWVLDERLYRPTPYAAIPRTMKTIWHTGHEAYFQGKVKGIDILILETTKEERAPLVHFKQVATRLGIVLFHAVTIVRGSRTEYWEHNQGLE